MEENKNFALLTDLYELTMMQGYFLEGNRDVAVFDMFYRKNPDGNGFAVMCGVEQLIQYIENLHFDDSDIRYLRNTGLFCDEFLKYLKTFRFSGDVYAVQEGTVIFPKEPIVKVVAPIMEAQLVETALLNIINHQSLIATKAERIVYAARGDGVMEFGLRRAQGPDAGIYGARAAVIGGCVGTSNVMAGKMFDIPVMGTHAHSWIMSFPDELTAFRKYAELYPQSCILLVDTYDTLRSGVPHAIQVFRELDDKGLLGQKYGIRLDSGDLAYLSKKARQMLDEAGYPDAVISASNDLDEGLISSLKAQGAEIHSWGVGTNLITSKDWPAFGGVYKLAAIRDEKTGKFVPKIKVSENTEKMTNPGNKTIYRIYDKETGKIIADLIALAEEEYEESDELTIFDPVDTWKRTVLEPNTYTLKELPMMVISKGERVFYSAPVMDLRYRCMREQETLWDESRRLTNPHAVHVDLSKPLYRMKKSLLNEMWRQEKK